MSKHSRTGHELGASETPWLVEIDGEYVAHYGTTRNDILTKHRAARDGTPIENDPTPPMKAGNYFQDGALEWFNEEFNARVVEPSVGYTNEFCNMTASLDGVFEEDWTYQDFTIAEGNNWECKIPRYPADPLDNMLRVIQCQAQMDCLDCELTVLAELARSDLIWRIAIIPRHEPTIKAIRDGVNEFWQKMEDDSNYPPQTSSEASRMIPGNRRPEPLDLTEDKAEHITREGRQHLIDSSENIITARRTKKSCDELIERESLLIKQIIGGAEKVILPDTTINFATREYKDQPAKTVPAKKGFVTRALMIKERKK